ncbi:MAG: CPBP family intramembrane glutamic endopeptidase [Leptospirales bacterium]
MKVLNKIVRVLVVDPWKQLEQEYGTEKRVELKILFVFFIIAFVLILRNYYGKFDNFRDFFPGFAKSSTTLPVAHCLYFTISAFLMYTFIPLIFAKVFYKEFNPIFGMSVKSLWKFKWIYAGMLCVMVPLIFIASQMPDFQRMYPMCKPANIGGINLVVWEISYAAQFFGVEFFFRGVLLFILARVYGPSAIFMMMVPYVMIHFGKPPLETVSAALAGTILGGIALYTKSIWGGFFLHTGVALGMDFASLYQSGHFN